MLLKNKIAVITGGGRGIGRSIAMHFASEGADVALIARSIGEINKVAEEIRSVGRKSIPVKADISQESAVNYAFEEIQNDLGPVDILVNNAGIEVKTPFTEMSMDEWDQTMAVNSRGTVLCTKAVLPDMLKRKNGNIINIASGAGLRGLPGSAAYGASKAAVIALTHSLADEIRDEGIRVNVICPGLIETDLLDPSELTENNPNILLPEDVAGTAVFIASNLSGNTTGQVFNVRNSNRW
jgi:3-oxoacyl-[acyl-carrier protein] reductase